MNIYRVLVNKSLGMSSFKIRNRDRSVKLGRMIGKWGVTMELAQRNSQPSSWLSSFVFGNYMNPSHKSITIGFTDQIFYI
jgi:hypothetical protein